MQTAVVLGASVGVGAEIATTLAQTHRVIAFHRGRHRDEAQKVDRALGEHDVRRRATTQRDHNVLHIRDVGSGAPAVDSGFDFLDYAEVRKQEVGVLVHALSGASLGDLLDLSQEHVERTFWCLAHSFLRWVQRLHAERLFAPHARVIALTNPCPHFYLRKSGAIGAAKAALAAYVQTLAVELQGTVLVTALEFGTVETPALEKVLGPDAMRHVQALHQDLVPGGAIQQGREIAEMVAWLATAPMSTVRGFNGHVIPYTAGAVSKLMNHAFFGGR